MFCCIGRTITCILFFNKGLDITNHKLLNMTSIMIKIYKKGGNMNKSSGKAVAYAQQK